ncbi:MAG: hypothetical protein JSV88_04190 [Candidatus Aminicenantes bacterium]|nr:MAG: hypothetical protein JSV88_04190 [Candidatus Aminicenantes bacterium]
MKKIISLFILLYCLCYSLSAIEIKQLREITLSHDQDAFIEKPGSFIVTVDGMFIVFDSKASNIKVYDGTGKLVNIFGRKGLGPDEFVQPYLSAYKEPFIVIGDFGRKTFFIYKRFGKNSFKIVQKLFLRVMCYDLHFIDDAKLLIAGYKVGKDRKEYNLYEYDFKNQNYEFILTSESSYGLESHKVYLKKYSDRIRYIGGLQYCDFAEDSIYLVWTGDLKIIKVDRKTKKYTFFGQKTGNYVQPYITPEIRKAYHERNHRLLYKFDNDMSYVKDIFVLTSEKVGVVYVGPLKKDKGISVMLQLYTVNGAFISEFKVLNSNASHQFEIFSFFIKDKNLLYIMDTYTSKEFDQFYKIHEFRIEE